MIEIPIWVFIMLVVGFSLFACLIIFGIIQVIHDKIMDYVERKKIYNKDKQFHLKRIRLELDEVLKDIENNYINANEVLEDDIKGTNTKH